MARVGVTYVDIAKAAEVIKTQGQEPTVDRVREHLGTGSKSTIAPLLKRWRSDNGGPADVRGLPNDLVDVVKSLHERVQQMADHRIEQAREAFNALNDELQKKFTEATSCLEEMTTRQQDLETQIKQLIEEKNLQNQSLQEERTNLAKTESQREAATAHVVELKETVADFRQENRDIRDHFEHYQQRTAEDRQQERDQFRATNQQLQDQVRELRAQLAQTEARVNDLLTIRDQLQKHIGEIEQANMALKSEISRKNDNIENLKRDFEVTLIQCNQYKDQNVQVTEQMALMAVQKIDAEKKVAVLSQALDGVKAELSKNQNKLVMLTDENKEILQEKAIIQGQLKQLQSSL